MCSYFDQFIVIQIFHPFFSDSFLIIFCVVLITYFLNKTYVIPTRIQNIIELIIEHWQDQVKENFDNKFFSLPLLTLFLFILFMNVFGFFLFTFPTTTHVSVTFGMALSIWLGVIIYGFLKFKLNFFSQFFPPGAPLYMSPLLVAIELVSNFSRPIALGLRLAANLTAGHLLLSIISEFGCKLLWAAPTFSIFSILIIMAMTCLELGVLVIQAYVFSLLSLIYLKDSYHLH
nr:ATP synthase F0 subunit 6 [Halistemma rubrum]